MTDTLVFDGLGLSYPSCSIDVELLGNLMMSQGDEVEITVDGWPSECHVILGALGNHFLSLDEDDLLDLGADSVSCTRDNDLDREDIIDALNRRKAGLGDLCEELRTLSQSDNTYNHESSIAGQVNYTVVPTDPDNSDSYDPCIVLFQTGTGDPRGGYGPLRAVFLEGGIATCQLVGVTIDAYITDSDGNSCHDEASTGYHGSCSFERLIENDIDGVTVALDADECPLFKGNDLVLVCDDTGDRLLASFSIPFVDC